MAFCCRFHQAGDRPTTADAGRKFGRNPRVSCSRARQFCLRVVPSCELASFQANFRVSAQGRLVHFALGSSACRVQVFLMVNLVLRPLLKVMRPKHTHHAHHTHHTQSAAATDASAASSTRRDSNNVNAGPLVRAQRAGSFSSVPLQPASIARFVVDICAKASRTALVMAWCCQLGYICNRWRVSDSTFVNVVIVRSLFPFLGTCFSLLDDAESIKPIGIYMLGNCLYASLNLLGRALHTQPDSLAHPLRVFGFAHPVLSALGVLTPSLLCSAVLKAL